MPTYDTFFVFATGVQNPFTAPAKTFAQWTAHVETVERTLGLERETYGDSTYWRRTDFAGVKDDVLCKTAESHNAWVRYVYDFISRRSKTPARPDAPTDDRHEVITPEMMATIWHALREIRVEPDRWNGDYYRDRMRHFYDVMRGRKSEGVELDVPALTAEQAGAVVVLFSEFLDPSDLRLRVPRGHDHLASFYWGEYDWCEYCGPVDEDDTCRHLVEEEVRERHCGICGWIDEDDPLCSHLLARAWCDTCEWGGERDTNGNCSHLAERACVLDEVTT